MAVLPVSFLVVYVHLRRFGKHSHDELSILVPLSQCCRSDFCSTVNFKHYFLRFYLESVTGIEKDVKLDFRIPSTILTDSHRAEIIK